MSVRSKKKSIVYALFLLLGVINTHCYQNCSKIDAAHTASSNSTPSIDPNNSMNTPNKVWSIKYQPPQLTNPITITLPGSYLSTTTHSLCSGPAYIVNLDNTKDYIIKTSEVLKAPVVLYGGRNVRVIGLEIDLSTSPCASQGASGYIPGVIALRAYQVGTTFIEGAYIDIAGRSADCIDPRNFINSFDALKKGSDEITARGARDVIIQNSICKGMSGDVNVHGDILQTQSMYELFNKVVFENVSTDSNCEGVIIEPFVGYPSADKIVFRNFDYQKDIRFSPNPVVGSPGQYYDGGFIQISAKNISYEQVFNLQLDAPYEFSTTIQSWKLNHTYSVGETVLWAGNVYQCITSGVSASMPGPNGNASSIVDGTAAWKFLSAAPMYQSQRPSCNISGGASGQLFCGATPTKDRFASPGTGSTTNDWVGLNYKSPHPL